MKHSGGHSTHYEPVAVAQQTPKFCYLLQLDVTDLAAFKLNFYCAGVKFRIKLISTRDVHNVKSKAAYLIFVTCFIPYMKLR